MARYEWIDGTITSSSYILMPLKGFQFLNTLGTPVPRVKCKGADKLTCSIRGDSAYEILQISVRSTWANPIRPVLECITTLNGSNTLAPFWSISKHNKGLID